MKSWKWCNYYISKPWNYFVHWEIMQTLNMPLTAFAKFELLSQLVSLNEIQPMEMAAFCKLYYTREVHLNVVSLYDYGTIIVTPRRVNISISTSVWTLLCAVHCTKLDSIYLFLDVLYKISSNYAAFMHYLLGSCITFFAKATHPERATDLIYHGDRPDSHEIAFSRIPAWHNVPLSPLKLAFITCRSH